MPERFGRFVLLEELERGWRGAEYRAAALAGTDLERLVGLLRVSPALVAGETLLEHLRAGARLVGPHSIAVLEVGRIDGATFVASELVEGKSLRSVLAKSREEMIPMALDNALQIATRVAAALEHAHAHTSREGAPFVHGMVGPDCVMVSYDGEVGLRGFGWWASRAWEGHLPEEDLRYLAPEQRGGVADPRSDVFAVGALLLECLTGLSPDAPLADARLPDGDPLPPAIAAVLVKALDQDPAGRFTDAHELRRAFDALLLSGEVSPTTFNLAYFMDTLFRDVIEQETRVLERERQAAYVDLEPEGPRQARSESRVAAPVHHEALPGRHAPPPVTKTPSARPAMTRAVTPRSRRAGGRAVRLVLPSVLLAAAVAAGSYVFLRPPTPPAPTPAPTPGPEEVAALARVQELESRLKVIEEEKARAEAEAAEEARQRLEAEAAKKGRAVDRAAVARAQEEAAQRARDEQEQRQVAERRRIAEEMQAEEARLRATRAAATPTPLTPMPTPSAMPSGTAVATAVDVTRPADEPSLPPVATPAPAAPPSTAAPAPSMAAPAPEATGSARSSPPVVYAANTPGVTAPVLQKGPPVEYPLLAKTARVQGVVVVSAVVDERGSVSEAHAVSPGNEILREAAVAHVLKRRYSPGDKDGMPVKVRIIVYVTFKFQN